MRKLFLFLLLLLLAGEARAALSTATGVMNAPGTASPTTASVTGLSFQPEVVIFFWNMLTANGSAGHSEQGIGWAIASGTNNQMAIGVSSEDVVTTSNVDRYGKNTTCIYHRLYDGTEALSATFTQFTSDGFDTSFSTTTSGVDIHYWCAGGDITNTYSTTVNKSGNLSVPVAQALTGFGFEPDFVLIAMDSVTADDGGSAVASKLSVGMASNYGGTLSQGVVTQFRNEAAGTSATASTQDTTNVIRMHTGGAESTTTTITSFDSDGITLSHTVNDAQSLRMRILAIKGGKWQVLPFLQKTSTGSKAYAGAGFTPKGGLFFGFNNAASGAITATASITIGATDGTNVGCIWTGDNNGSALMVADQNSDTTKLLKSMTAVVLVAPTTEAAATLTSLDSDGFTLNWGTADGTARQWLGVLAGNAPIIKPIVTFGGDDK